MSGLQYIIQQEILLISLDFSLMGHTLYHFPLCMTWLMEHLASDAVSVLLFACYLHTNYLHPGISHSSVSVIHFLYVVSLRQKEYRLAMWHHSRCGNKSYLLIKSNTSTHVKEHGSSQLDLSWLCSSVQPRSQSEHICSLKHWKYRMKRHIWCFLCHLHKSILYQGIIPVVV